MSDITTKRTEVPEADTGIRTGTGTVIEGNGAHAVPVDSEVAVGEAEAGLAEPSAVYASFDEQYSLPPRRKPWLVLVAGALALVLLAVVGWWLLRPTSNVTTATVRRGSIISTVETTGKVQAEHSAKLAFKAPGRVARVLVEAGDLVKAGDVLVELDTSSLQRQLEEAKAQAEIARLKLTQAKEGARPEDITAAQARLDQARASQTQVANSAASAKEQARIAVDQAANAVQNAQDAYDRIKRQNQGRQVTEDERLAEHKALRDLQNAQGQLEQARIKYDEAKKNETALNEAAEAQVREAQAALDKLKAGATPQDIAILEQQYNLARMAVEDIQAQIAEARLTSPVDGTVLSIDLDEGELVGAYQPVAVVADPGSLRVKADIDEMDVGRVNVGQPVTITLDAYPGVPMPGRIEWLAPGATLKQGSTVFQATISFTPPQGVQPREGMAANVDITAQRKDGVLLLPNRAFETVGKRQYVTLKEGNSTRKVEVVTGLSNSTDTEVVSGLREGQVVVLR
jgi:RND family efflux transporter MFP subunit